MLKLLAFIKRHYTKALLALVVFYYMFPQAIAIMGSSFILYAGVFGMLLYLHHKRPFREVLYFLIVFCTYIGISIFASKVNNTVDPFWMSYLRSQMAWFFGAYLIMFFIFKVHKTPTAETVVTYILVALALQAFFTALMFFNEGAKDFLFSFQLQTHVTEEVKEEIEGQRLLGYGVALFGAGVGAGYCLILITFFLFKSKLKFIYVLFLTLLYVFVFYIGLFSARTTVVGFAMSFSMILLLRFKQSNVKKKQVYWFIGTLVGLLLIGYSLCYIYFPSFTTWAFELLDNFIAHGSLETRSSNGLSGMLYAPEDFQTLVFGRGDLDITGSDVGYTRLMFQSGVPGMIAFYAIVVYLGYLCLTRDWNMNYLVIISTGYTFAMNFKGIVDINMMMYLYFFYFMYYKYYVFAPRLYLQRQMERKLAEQATYQNA